MYLPPHFEETEPAEISGLVEAFPLAAVVAQTADGVLANHIPLFLQAESLLVGHIALANEMHRLLADQSKVLAIFRGEDAYVSPNWYPSKQTHHRHVPTWNYRVVHAEGRIRFSHDAKDKRAVVGRLTKLMETGTNGAAAWRMADAPEDYMESMLDNIVAFRIEVESFAAKSKLSQNRERTDFNNVAQVMEQRGERGMAEAMRKRGPSR